MKNKSDNYLLRNPPEQILSVQINRNTSNHSKMSNDVSYANLTQNQTELKGTTKTFRFTIPISNDYEPLIMKIYDSKNDNFIKNLYIEKKLIISYFSNVFKSILISDVYNKNFLSL